MSVGNTSPSAEPPKKQPTSEERVANLREGLQRALNDRDPKATLEVTQAIKQDPVTYTALLPDLEEALKHEPDALYAIARAHLNADPALVDETWQNWLHRSANEALKVAIDEGDPVTILNWLTLISREPPQFKLGDILREGITAATPRAYDNAALAQGIFQVLSKRDLQGFKAALNDDALFGALTSEMISSLMVLILKEHRDEQFPTLVKRLSGRSGRMELLVSAFQRSGRPAGDILALSAVLTTLGELTPQQLLDLDLALIDARGWSAEMLPLMAQTAQLMQTPELHVNGIIPWKMLEVAEKQRDEQIIRGAARRIMQHLERLEDDETFVEEFSQLARILSWSAAAEASVRGWWRTQAHKLSTPKLNKLDRLMEPHRSLEEMRASLRSILSIRRMFARKSLEEFSSSIALAHSVLQTLAEAYSGSRRNAEYDVEALRAELDNFLEEASPDTIKLLSNNLRALAALIGELGDERTKTSIMRRADDVDHQLASGELQPHGAVDALKWIAGFLDGSQNKD
ncbi:MAG: hypothetical protein IAE89_04895 [Anaerolineae bacterium]|nr:hypothetical protein [Anaerolineae bacterium]